VNLLTTQKISSANAAGAQDADIQWALKAFTHRSQYIHTTPTTSTGIIETAVVVLL